MARPRTLSASFARIRQEQRLLYDWLRDCHDEFAAELAAVRVRDRWTRALKVIAEHGLVDNRGSPVTRDTAIRTWKRVREDVAAARARRQGAPSPALTPGEVAPGVRAAKEQAAAPAPVLVPAQGVTAAAAGAAQESDSLQRLRASMQAGKVPMPKTVR